MPDAPGSFSIPLDTVLGGKTAQTLKKNFGFVSVGDLLHNFPRRYVQRGHLTSMANVATGEPVTVMGTVISSTAKRMHTKRGFVLSVKVSDGDRAIGLTFFNQKWRERELKPGVTGLFAGTVSSFNGTLTLHHPQYLLFDSHDSDDVDSLSTFAGGIIPVYPSTKTVASWTIAACVDIALRTLDELPDPIPAEIRAQEGLMERSDAFRVIHRPDSLEELEHAQRRIRFEEAFVLLVILEQHRKERGKQRSVSRSITDGKRLTSFDSHLPFDLTPSQKSVGIDIARDLGSEKPMMRLLQGDVGSGKTVVALRAMLQTIDSGGQVALLAPTEVLALQHFETITRFLRPITNPVVTVTLLIGSLATQQRRQALTSITSGQASIIIGTHALFQESVQYCDLGLVVIDEQHRFGVEQRAALTSKKSLLYSDSELKPHVLVMTATPIPRTIALTAFGDLDFSTITELPKGRMPIQTFLVNPVQKPRHVERVWERVAEEVSAGNKVFVVCPSISPSESTLGDSRHTDIASVETTHAFLSALYPNIPIGIVHGSLSSHEQQAAMESFQSDGSGGFKVLVSTTIIEVGVDIPEATLMVVLNAERFGISQLHQLRGRVGRGERPGLCILVSDAAPDSDAGTRLEALCSTLNGFEIAQRDLEIRGEGDMLGRMQSGDRSTLRLLRMIEDSDLIEHVQELIAGISHTPLWDQAISAIDSADTSRAEFLGKT